MRPCKFFNLMLGFDTYTELKNIARKTERSIAEVIRIAIDQYLRTGRLNEKIQKTT